MNISVIGCGRWGTFIAWYLDHIGHCVKLYGKDGSQHFGQLKRDKANEYLKLSDSIELTSDLKNTVDFADTIVISVGAQNFRECIIDVSKYNIIDKNVMLCMKGIEIDTGKTLTQVAKECIPTLDRLAIWVGPGHVQDFIRGIPNCMVIDSYDEQLKEQLINEFSSELIRFYFGKDLIGNEIGAATKNIIGIAAGFLDGLGYGSLKGALMSRATREIARLLKSLGCKEQSAYGLCHLGDYEATLFSKHSHNRMYGETFVKGEKFAKLSEGVYTTKAIVKIGIEKNVELPICQAVYDVLYNGKGVKETLYKLFVRSLTSEF